MKIPSFAIALLVAAAGLVQATSLRISEATESPEEGTTVLPFQNHIRIENLNVRNAAIITEKDVEKAMAYSSDKGYGILLTLNREGEKRFHAGIQHLEWKRIAILIDGKVISAPVLSGTSFGKELRVNGPFTETEALAFAKALSPSVK
jgi:preprotein translocase subunit SecD